MAALDKNLIAGAWVEGATATPNANASGAGDVVGEYALANAAQTKAAIAADLREPTRAAEFSATVKLAYSLA